jgi:hypothetical protein
MWTQTMVEMEGGGGGVTSPRMVGAEVEGGGMGALGSYPSVPNPPEGEVELEGESYERCLDSVVIFGLGVGLWLGLWLGLGVGVGVGVG